LSGKTPITLSGGFSVETLTEVTLSWKTEFNRSISTMKDGIFHPDDCSTTIRRVARNVAAMEGRVVCFGDDFTMGM